MEEIRLMKGNEVVAEAAVRCGCDGYFGYPITPQSEILETLTAMRPWGDDRYGRVAGRERSGGGEHAFTAARPAVSG